MKLDVEFDNGETEVISISQVEPVDENYDPPETGSTVCCKVRGSRYTATIRGVQKISKVCYYVARINMQMLDGEHFVHIFTHINHYCRQKNPKTPRNPLCRYITTASQLLNMYSNFDTICIFVGEKKAKQCQQPLEVK